MIMKFKYIFGISLLIGGSMVATSCKDDDDDASISTSPIITNVTTGTAAITSVSATISNNSVNSLAGQSASAYSIGVIYNTDSATINNGTSATASLNSDGTTYNVEITGLKRNQKYYYKAFVTLQGKITYMGGVKKFITTDATVTTAAASSITAASASLGGSLTNVSSLPDDATLTCGVIVSADSADAANHVGQEMEYSDVTSAASGSAYAISKLGLLPGKMYFTTAFMRLNDGYIYGDVKHFTTATNSTSFVDLGLSVYWAKANVGAINEEDYGGLYGYGDATGLKMLSTDTYASTDIVGTSNDIAVASGNGRMPSFSEAKELTSKCTFTDETVNSVAGVRVTGPNGNSIFIPKAGYRVNNSVRSQAEVAYLWTGTVNANDNTHAATINLKSSDDTYGNALTYQGLSARAVIRPNVVFDASKIKYGDLEGNGNYRMEFYNAYSSTASDPCLNVSNFAFYKSMHVNFTVAGLGKNVSGVTATIGFASGDWSVQDWASSVNITGDGNYTINVNTTNPAKGIMVFVIDIKGLTADQLASVKAYYNSIITDVDNTTSFATACDGGTIVQKNIAKGDIEKKGNYRMELHNEYGSNLYCVPGVESMTFSSFVAVNFHISGLGALSKAYPAAVIFGDNSWAVGNWAAGTEGDASVTGDGDYTVYFKPSALTTAPAHVFCVDIIGLCNDVSADKINCTVTGLTWK
jgi:hypothetical protein